MNNELLDMLTYCRPAGSLTERMFIEKYVLTLPGVEFDYCKPYGNWHVQVGQSRILWSCHTDTVHYDGRRQRVKQNRKGIIRLHRKERTSNCLGADDTAGVYILRQMILRGIPGHYVFHGAEECGGKGSKALADAHGQWLMDSFDYAIALDRAGYSDIITHQMYGRTASDMFAWSLSEAMNMPTYEPCSHGIYTDTAEYGDLISECSNLSIGYENAHTWRETLDSQHVASLLTALCTLDVSLLVHDRLPGEDDPYIPPVIKPLVFDVLDFDTRDYSWLPERYTDDEDLPDEVETLDLDSAEYLNPDYAAVMRDYKTNPRYWR